MVVNDFTRGFATTSYAGLLATRLRTSIAEVAQRVQFIMSGGTEGIMTPHVSVFVRREVREGSRSGKGLVAGIASTRPIEPEEPRPWPMFGSCPRGRARHGRRGITDRADVHFVQIKCPLLTTEAISGALASGKRVATTSTYGSMGATRRAAAALGVGRALGEVPAGALDDTVIARRWDLFSGVA